jgi:dTDP-4-amino-4,6-dideoxygalactose transaminase
VTSAEGGLACFRDPAVAERFRLLRSYGFIGDYNCKEVGLNGKISELNAALGWLSLGMVSEALARREGLLRVYRELLQGERDITFQHVPERCVSGYKDFAVLFRRPEQRALAESALRLAGVQTKRYFFPVHRMHAYAAFRRAPLPVTEDVYERCLCLPIYYDLRIEEIEFICRVVRDAVRGRTGLRKAQ